MNIEYPTPNCVLKVVFDISGSMIGNRFNSCSQSIIANFNEFPDGTIVKLIFFNEQVFVCDDVFVLPGDINKIQEKFSKSDCNGKTSLYDALQTAEKDLAQNEFIFLLTDGEDNSSVCDIHTFKQLCQKLESTKQLTLISPKNLDFDNQLEVQSTTTKLMKQLSKQVSDLML